MSSATSIKRLARVRLKAEAPAGRARRPGGSDTPVEPPADAGFRPWHFFVLASLLAATAAVVVSRQATPEHLILISLTIAAAGVAAAGFYRTLAPLAIDDPHLYSEPISERTRATLQREKVLTLRSIKELEFDRAMGKVSERDFDEMAGRLRARAVTLMRALEETGTSYRDRIERDLTSRLAAQGVSVAAPPASCGACGAANDSDAAFCKKCGARLLSVPAGAQ